QMPIAGSSVNRNPQPSPARIPVLETPCTQPTTICAHHRGSTMLPTIASAMSTATMPRMMVALRSHVGGTPSVYRQRDPDLPAPWADSVPGGCAVPDDDPLRWNRPVPEDGFSGRCGSSLLIGPSWQEQLVIAQEVQCGVGLAVPLACSGRGPADAAEEHVAR